MRPVTIDDGLARRRQAVAPSLVSAHSNPRWFPAGFSGVERIDRISQNNFPFREQAQVLLACRREGYGEGSPCESAGGSGAACWAGGLDAKRGRRRRLRHAAPAAISDINRAADAASGGMSWTAQSVAGSIKQAI